MRAPSFSSVCSVAVAVLCSGAATMLLPFGCTVPDPNANAEVVAPPLDQFEGPNQNGVSHMLENRCGMLDCHGSASRPLRIYGSNGLRLEEGDATVLSGQGLTTPDEQTANYQAVIGLQPELISQVWECQASPGELLLMRKPLLLERHKGGQAFNEDPTDDAFYCIYTWLTSNCGDGGATDFSACAASSNL